jgi:hypothetical protein
MKDRYREKVLKHLLRIAQKVIDYRHMEMTHWFEHIGSGHAHFKPNGLLNPKGCGTSACLLGWAATDARFHKLTGAQTVDIAGGGQVYNENGCPVDASDLHLTYGEFSYLFGAAMSGKKRDVITRIKEVMRGDIY